MMHIYTFLNELTVPLLPGAEYIPTGVCQPLSGQPDSLAGFDKKNRPSASEIFTRSAISHHCNCSPESIAIERDARGKPHCRVPENGIHFNLSHSGRWTVCAVAEKEVGIDIQKMIPLPVSRQNSLSRKILTKDERIEYAALPDCEQPDFLYRRFSMKESCVKAVGLGMRIPFSTITLKEEKNYFTWEDRSTQFFIREYFFDPEYKLSLCSIQRSVAEIQSLE